MRQKFVRLLPYLGLVLLLAPCYFIFIVQGVLNANEPTATPEPTPPVNFAQCMQGDMAAVVPGSVIAFYPSPDEKWLAYLLNLESYRVEARLNLPLFLLPLARPEQNVLLTEDGWRVGELTPPNFEWNLAEETLTIGNEQEYLHFTFPE